MDLKNEVLNNYKLDMNKYCKVFNGEFYSLYFANTYC